MGASCSLGVLTLLAGCSGSVGSLEEGEPVHVRVAFGEAGRGPGQFVYPRAIDHFRDGVIVIDKAARVQFLGPDGQFRRGFVMPQFELGKPTGVTVGPSLLDPEKDAIYIADTHYQQIAMFDAESLAGADADGYPPHGEMIDTPEPLFRFGEFGRGPSQFIYPTDVAILTSEDDPRKIERIYVSEYGGNDRISVFKPSINEAGGADLEFLFSFGQQGTDVGTIGSNEDVWFDRPQSILIEPGLKELVIADGCNHRLGRFTYDGELIGWIGGLESEEPDRFRFPYGTTLVAPGELLVSEFGNCRVQQIDIASGATTAVYGVAGRGEGELSTPWGVTVADGLAYVLDSGNNRVYGFSVRGGVHASVAHGGATP